MPGWIIIRDPLLSTHLHPDHGYLGLVLEKSTARKCKTERQLLMLFQNFTLIILVSQPCLKGGLKGLCRGTAIIR